MLPVKEKMTLYDNSVLPFRFPVETAEDPAGWTFQGYVYDKAAPGTKVVTLDITWDPSGKVGATSYDAAEVVAALPGAKT
jgi:hypothetical protein